MLEAFPLSLFLFILANTFGVFEKDYLYFNSGLFYSNNFALFNI